MTLSCFPVTIGSDVVYHSPTLTSLWGQGHASIGALTFDSAAYVARYCMKKVNGSEQDKEEAYTRYMYVDTETGECHAVRVRPEFNVMSRRPGLGAGWFEKYGKTDVLPFDEVVHRGRSYRPPRFYDNQLSEEELARVKDKRARAVQGYLQDNTYERLAVQEQVAEARLSQLRRQL